MKHLVKKSVVELPPIQGAIADTTNINDKITNTYSARIIDEKLSNVGVDIATIVDLIYPIGRGFLDFTNTDYSNWLGLTWERELLGMFPVGYNPNDTTFSGIGDKGGEKEHILTTNEMPSHTHIQNSHNHTQNAHGHSLTASGGWNSGATIRLKFEESNTTRSMSIPSTTATNQATTATNQNTGGGAAHNNLPPYQVVSYWKRVDPNAKTMISFTVNSVSCQAEEGMTWAEWCNSSYNTLGYYTSGNLVYGSSGTYLSSATASSVIGNGASYYYSKEK